MANKRLLTSLEEAVRAMPANRTMDRHPIEKHFH